MVLYKYGGIYYGSENIIFEPIRKIIQNHEIVFLVDIEQDKDDNSLINNSFMAAYPNHPLIGFIL